MKRLDNPDLHNLVITDVEFRTGPEGLQVTANAVLRGNDLNYPPSTVTINRWSHWHPDIYAAARELLLAMEAHMAHGLENPEKAFLDIIPAREDKKDKGRSLVDELQEKDLVDAFPDTSGEGY